MWPTAGQRYPQNPPLLPVHCNECLHGYMDNILFIPFFLLFHILQATGGGRMKYEHFEMARLQVARKLDQKRMFAIWRIEPPWQPVTKKGQGQRMGGGKGAIDHYVTPIKAGRIILEVGGKCEYAEV